LVGRVTPCAPFGEAIPAGGAHGVTRPTKLVWKFLGHTTHFIAAHTARLGCKAFHQVVGQSPRAPVIRFSSQQFSFWRIRGVRCPPFRVSAAVKHAKAWTPNAWESWESQKENCCFQVGELLHQCGYGVQHGSACVCSRRAPAATGHILEVPTFGVPRSRG